MSDPNRQQQAYERQIERSRLVKQEVVGRWDYILARFCPDIMAARAKGVYQHTTCPFHGGKNDFRLANDYVMTGVSHCSCGNHSGFDLVMKVNDWDYGTCIREMYDHLCGNAREYIPPKVTQASIEAQRKNTAKKDSESKSRSIRWWSGTIALEAPEAKLAREYLRNRGLEYVALPLKDVRYHPSLNYSTPLTLKDGTSTFVTLGHFPALISVVRCPDGRVSTVHRTYLSHEGRKLALNESLCGVKNWELVRELELPARKMHAGPSTNPAMGGAIRLDDYIHPVLHVAEGLETALAVRSFLDQPVWSTVNKEMLKALVIPDHVRLVVVWADKDKSRAGEEAAVTLMEKLELVGVDCIVAVPPFQIPEGMKGIDWNDVVARLGAWETIKLPGMSDVRDRIKNYLS